MSVLARLRSILAQECSCSRSPRFSATPSFLAHATISCIRLLLLLTLHRRQKELSIQPVEDVNEKFMKLVIDMVVGHKITSLGIGSLPLIRQ